MESVVMLGWCGGWQAGIGGTPGMRRPPGRPTSSPRAGLAGAAPRRSRISSQIRQCSALSVVKALLGTGVAHRFARLEVGLCGGRIEFGLACEYAAGRLEHVRAVNTELEDGISVTSSSSRSASAQAVQDERRTRMPRGFHDQLAVQGAWPTMRPTSRCAAAHDSSLDGVSSGPMPATFSRR